MATWAKQELARIGGAFELYVLTRSLDGALRTGIPIWQVRVGDAIYIKSAHGRRTAGSGGWCAPDSGALGRVALKRTSRSESASPQVSAVYRATYDHYGPALVGAVTDDVLQTTLRVMPGN